MSQVTMKMYNAGTRFQVSLYFNPTDGHDNAVNGRWSKDIPAESFFDVPVVLELANGSEISVRFPQDIIRLHPTRGVILIDPNYKGEAAPHVPISKTDDEAIEKGNELWGQYLEQICFNHFNECANLKAQGAAPRAAIGFTKYALKKRGMADPGDAVSNAERIIESKSGGSSSDFSNLSKQLEEMKAQVAALTNSKKLREEAEAKANELEQVEQAIDGASTSQKKK